MTRGAPRTPDLLSRFREGDEEAYRILFERYEDALRAFIHAHTDAHFRRHMSVEDLFQETHVEALRGLAKFEYRRELSFYFWLCGIARRRIYEHCRRRNRQVPTVSFTLASAHRTTSAKLIRILEADGPDPLEQVEHREHVTVVALALERLPEEQREALLLRYVEDRNSSEAAALLGINASTFRMRLSRGLVRLRTALAGLLDEPDEGTDRDDP